MQTEQDAAWNAAHEQIDAAMKAQYPDYPVIALERSFDEICEDSRIAVSDSDAAAWRIGDNAVEVLARFNELTLADYAREIGKPKGTVAEYRQMSAMYNPRLRSEIADQCPNITRSHMRKVLFMHDPDKARWAVEKASDRGWTVDQFGYILKRYKRLKGIGRAAPPKPVVQTFEVDNDFVIQPVAERRRYQDILAKHPDAITQIVVTWTPDARGRGHAVAAVRLAKVNRTLPKQK
jgi:hypothetical protein